VQQNRERASAKRDLRRFLKYCLQKQYSVGTGILDCPQKNVTKAEQTFQKPFADPAARSNRACGFGSARALGALPIQNFDFAINPNLSFSSKHFSPRSFATLEDDRRKMRCEES